MIIINIRCLTGIVEIIDDSINFAKLIDYLIGTELAVGEPKTYWVDPVLKDLVCLS